MVLPLIIDLIIFRDFRSIYFIIVVHLHASTFALCLLRLYESFDIVNIYGVTYLYDILLGIFFFFFLLYFDPTTVRRSTDVYVPLHCQVLSASRTGRGWMCLDISDGGEEKCIGRNSWPKCDRCACAAAVMDAQISTVIYYFYYIRIYNIYLF